MPAFPFVPAQQRLSIQIGAIGISVAAQKEINSSEVIQKSNLIFGRISRLCNDQRVLVGAESAGIIAREYLSAPHDRQAIDFDRSGGDFV